MTDSLLFSYQIRAIRVGYGQVKRHEGRLWLASSLEQYFHHNSMFFVAESASSKLYLPRLEGCASFHVSGHV